jgi:hypothetical protein
MNDEDACRIAKEVASDFLIGEKEKEKGIKLPKDERTVLEKEVCSLFGEYGIRMSYEEIEALVEMRLQDWLFLKKARDEKFDPRMSVRVKIDGEEEGGARLRMVTTSPLHGQDLLKSLREHKKAVVYNTSISEFVLKGGEAKKELESKK